jgi:hypothetical protein
MGRSRQAVRQLARFGVLAYFVFLPIFMLYDRINPWQPAQQLLSHYSGQVPILVWFSSDTRWEKKLFDSDSPARTTRYESRSYVLLPAVFDHPMIVSVSQVNDLPPITDESPSRFLLWFGWLVVGVLAACWAWRRSGESGAT